MHQPFHLNNPNQIQLTSNSNPTALYLHLNQLYVGTSDGSLYIYQIQIQNQNQNQISIQLLNSFIHFTSKHNNNNQFKSSTPTPIESINLIKQTNSLVTLSAGDILIHDLNNFQLQSSSQQWTKSQASIMVLENSILRQNQEGKIDLNSNQKIPSSNQNNNNNKSTLKVETVQAQTNNTSELPSSSSSSSSFDIPIIFTILAVPCKRRLVLFSWKDSQWINPKEIGLPHQARSIVFATPLKLFIGYSTGTYATLKLNISSDPIITPFDHELSEPFTLPSITSSLETGSTSSSTNTTGLVSGLSGLAFKTTTGLVNLGLTGTTKLARNPVIRIGLPTQEVIGMRDHLATVMNSDGKLGRSNKSSTIIYESTPIETIVKGPYIISLFSPNINQPACLIIHSLPTLSYIQTIQFSINQVIKTDENSSPRKIKTNNQIDQLGLRRLLTTSSNHNSPIFCVSSELDSKEQGLNTYYIEILNMKNWNEQFEELIELGEYSEALDLLKSLDQSIMPDHAELLKRLESLCALIKFSKFKIDEAIDEFIKLNINPIKVISLYPIKISGKFHQKRESWEFIFGGRSIESYLNSKNNDPLIKLNPNNHLKVDNNLIISGNSNVEDESSSITSLKSNLKSFNAKPSDVSIQKPTIENKDEDKNFQNSVEELIRYLTDRRQQVNKALISHTINLDSLKSIPLKTTEELFLINFQEPLSELKNLNDLVQIAKIIDTSLFKSYLSIKPNMLGPLCRLPNWCEIDEVESLLLESKRFHELLDLYRGKNQHDRALKLLKQMGEEELELERRISPTITYLQKLDEKHLDLILETSKWLLNQTKNNADPIDNDETNNHQNQALIKRVLEIFTADLSTVESLPRKSVMNFLEKEHLLGCRIYIEHLIHNLNEKGIEFHEKLIHLYIIEFKRLKSLNDQEAAEKIYECLLNHLINSDSYSPNWCLGRLPLEDMDHARALALGKLGQHDSALGIYVHKLGNIKLAEDYCKRIYNSAIKTEENIYIILLRIYLRPNPNIISKLNNEKRLESAINLINFENFKISNDYQNSIELILNLLPDLISLNNLNLYLKNSIKNLVKLQRLQLINQFLCKSRLNSLNQFIIELEERNVKVDDKKLCFKCGKRLGNSVIAVHTPFGEVTHYQCRWHGHGTTKEDKNRFQVLSKID
ncbi:hypothetical protein CROQUDRAFT_63207 [Cronartium quercuum f. sp. fusiforme G11]|uniref:CNH domain-containing protein n=1 Tax=Cronartium quercuum f. sp. fusiforme G11 TaxID=708437 RepID=A0A9P6NMI4_9BASI|nr:hypothetical protein CROQUDRAFT_63207 [Cronartium quercuum f. sp. fusiforme G11]